MLSVLISGWDFLIVVFVQRIYLFDETLFCTILTLGWKLLIFVFVRRLYLFDEALSCTIDVFGVIFLRASICLCVERPWVVWTLLPPLCWWDTWATVLPFFDGLLIPICWHFLFRK